MTWLALLLAPPALATECDGPCGADAACAHGTAACLLAAGQAREAVAVLKEARRAAPADGALARHLALAYHQADNQVWALRTVLDQLQQDPSDQETRTWAAFLAMDQGDLEQARALLAAVEGDMAPRALVLQAALAQLAQDDAGAETALGAAMKAPRLLAEDRALLDRLRRDLRGDAGEPIVFRGLLGVGYATNATQGTPEEAIAAVASPVVEPDLLLRFEPWASPRLRPVADARLSASLPTASAAADYGTTTLDARLGPELGRTTAARARLLYGAELLRIHGPDVYLEDTGRWFLEAHRLDLEVDPAPWLQAFVGGGRRVYREMARTRTELDGGLAAVGGAGPLHLTGLAAGRWYHASTDTWSGWGATALARVVVPLPADFSLRLRGLAVADFYPDSEEYYDLDEPRRDLLVKLSLGPWSPPLGRSTRLGLTWTWSDKHTTVVAAGGAPGRYDYTDNRVILEIRYEGSVDPFAPRRASAEPGHLAPPYGLATEGDLGLDRVQDLLRQEESARRGSSCAD